MKGYIVLINRIFFYSLTFSILQVAIANAAEVILSENELTYLAEKKEIRKCVDPLWMPFESIDKSGEHVGIIADITDKIVEKISLPITLVKTSDWSESHQFLQKRLCDIVTSDAITDLDSDYFVNSIPYLQYKDVYITRKSTELALNFEAITARKIGFVKDYPTIALAKEMFPNTNVIEVNSVDEGVLKVSRGDLYAFVDLLPAISYSIQSQGLTNLKVAGHVDIDIPIVMSIRNDQPELISIINKSLSAISNQTKNEIFNHWVSVDYVRDIDYILILKILIVSIFIATLSFYFISKNRMLKHKVSVAEERERLMRDMHDGVGGHLVSLLALLDSDTATTPEHIKQSIKECLSDLRVVILSLEASSGDLETLLGMFRHNIKQKITASGMELIWDIGNLSRVPELSSRNALNILRILQEAITNIIKHSGATLIKMSAEQVDTKFDSFVVIKVIDNGSGKLDSDSTGYGIVNMQKRAEELNGGIDIQLKEGESRVILTFPIWLP